MECAHKFSNVCGNHKCKMSPLFRYTNFASTYASRNYSSPFINANMLQLFIENCDLLFKVIDLENRFPPFCRCNLLSVCLDTRIGCMKDYMFKSDLFITWSNLPVQLTKSYHHLPLHKDLNSLHTLSTSFLK